METKKYLSCQFALCQQSSTPTLNQIKWRTLSDSPCFLRKYGIVAKLLSATTAYTISFLSMRLLSTIYPLTIRISRKLSATESEDSLILSILPLGLKNRAKYFQREHLCKRSITFTLKLQWRKFSLWPQVSKTMIWRILPSTKLDLIVSWLLGCSSIYPD